MRAINVATATVRCCYSPVYGTVLSYFRIYFPNDSNETYSARGVFFNSTQYSTVDSIVPSSKDTEHTYTRGGGGTRGEFFRRSLNSDYSRKLFYLQVKKLDYLFTNFSRYSLDCSSSNRRLSSVRVEKVLFTAAALFGAEILLFFEPYMPLKMTIIGVILSRTLCQICGAVIYLNDRN